MQPAVLRSNSESFFWRIVAFLLYPFKVLWRLIVGESIDFRSLDRMEREELIEFCEDHKISGFEMCRESATAMQSMPLRSRHVLSNMWELDYELSKKFPKRRTGGSSSSRGGSGKKMQFASFALANCFKDAEKIDECEFPYLFGDKVKPETPYDSSPIDKTDLVGSFSVDSGGSDMYGVSRSMMKILPSYMHDKIVALFHSLLKGEVDPKLCVGKSVFLFKDKGDKGVIGNYRRITSLPNLTNCLHRILNARMTNYMKKNGFFNTTIQKAGVSAASHGVFEQIYKVRSVIKDANQSKQPCSMLFLDIKSAFDNIDRECVFKVMEHYGIDKSVIDYFRAFYDHLVYYVYGSGRSGELREWKNGLIQGCSASPLLFTMCINYILTYMNRTSFTKNAYKFKENGQGVLTLAYMDDVAITCNSFSSLNEVYVELKEILENFGLEISLPKCAMMIINEEVDDLLDMKDVPISPQTKYLGAVITSNGDYRRDYESLVKEINGRLQELKDIDPDYREDRFKKILPTIKRSLLRLYDAEGEDMGTLIAIVENSLQGLGISTEGVDLDLSNTIDYILTESADDVIKKIPASINIVKNKKPVKPSKLDLDEIKASYQNIKRDLEVGDNIEVATVAATAETGDADDEESEDVGFATVAVVEKVLKKKPIIEEEINSEDED